MTTYTHGVLTCNGGMWGVTCMVDGKLTCNYLRDEISTHYLIVLDKLSEEGWEFVSENQERFYLRKAKPAPSATWRDC